MKLKFLTALLPMVAVLAIIPALAGASTSPQHVGIQQAHAPRMVAPGGLAGYKAAMKAGAKVTPAAKAIMKQFPAGSCSNNPFQRKCGKPPKYLYAQTDLTHPPRSLKAFLARHHAHSYTGCKQRVTELNSTYVQEIAKGYQRCWGVVSTQCAYLLLQQKSAAGNWADQAASHDDCKPNNGHETGGDGTIYNDVWVWCAESGGPYWRWQRAYEEGQHTEVTGGVEYSKAQLVHRGCVDQHQESNRRHPSQKGLSSR